VAGSVVLYVKVIEGVTGDPGSEVRRSRVAVSPAACLGSSVRISCEAQR
jgi:hypothetical protein